MLLRYSKNTKNKIVISFVSYYFTEVFCTTEYLSGKHDAVFIVEMLKKENT